MRVWFNHWFSTASHLIRLMRQGRADAFIGSGSNPRAAYRQACDEWYDEPAQPPEDYADFCLDFCRRHAIDVFVPRRGMLEVVRAAERFEAQGVRLLAERDAGLVGLLEDKVRTYRFFEERLPGIVPDHRLADSLEAFEAACDGLSSPSGRLCYKLVTDEGARSFRVLDDSIETVKALYEKPGTKVTRRAAAAILSQYDFSVPLIVMPYLSGADVSVDCLDTAGGRIILPRFKVGRYHEVRPDAQITALCEAIMDALGPQMPVNIQFRMESGRPYLLEINPRMSGGLQLSCAATGIDLPALALAKLLGQPAAWRYPEPWLPVELVNLETPVVLELDRKDGA
ncbi:MAG: ATP-grasp domain-containing protein [Clostridia bacterium]|nr:ATP-grasp domain-containing protein [Clostridia bacterium]